MGEGVLLENITDVETFDEIQQTPRKGYVMWSSKMSQNIDRANKNIQFPFNFLVLSITKMALSLEPYA